MTEYRRALPIILLVALALTSCNNNQVTTAIIVPTQPPTNPAVKDTPLPTLIPTPFASIKFLGTAVELDGIQWMEDQAIELGVKLEINGVYALNKDSAFLFGGLTVPAGTIRSILVRSDDGGNHWQEVMPPVPGSKVFRITFLENGEGWALAGWTVESPGPFTMYHSLDYGQSWDKLSEISNTWGVPYGIKFSNRQKGQIKVVNFSANPYSDRLSILTTTDGGLAWKETGSVPIWEKWKGNGYTPKMAIDTSNKVELEKQFALLAGWEEKSDGWSECLWQSCEAVGQDGSEWQTSYYRENISPIHLIVRRQLSSEKTWAVYTLPVNFNYSDGRILVP